MTNETLFWQGIAEASTGLLLIFLGIGGAIILWVKGRNSK